jgi:hypothetical protein
MYEVVELTWEEVLPIWRNQLWPNRKSEIKTHSSMVYLGGYDMSIYNNPVHYWGFKSNTEEVFGVLSGFKSGPDIYCYRGLWLHESLRGQNLSQVLFANGEEIAKQQGCTGLWDFRKNKS